MGFDSFFHPRGIAVVGASGDMSRIGGHSIKALKKAGYKGGIFPINPKYPEIQGLKCYPSVAAIDAPCDLAVIAVPAAQSPAAIRDCGKAGIRAAVVLTAGFREAGAEGRALEAELLSAARETGVRMVGPNCQGLLSVQDRVWTVFGSVSEETELRPGRVSCAFQSGGFGYAIVNLAETQGVGFRFCVSTGNETDITTPDLIDAFLDDPGTEMAFGLLEGTPDARKLLDVGRKSLLTGKPVLIWKSATTDAGAKAAQSHTANMTGRSDLYRAAFRQSGLIEVDDVEPITDFAKTVAQQRWPLGLRVGVLSISGGSGIVLADRLTQRGLTLPAFSQTTHEALSKAIPSFGSVHNPADVTAGVFNNMKLLTETLDIVLADENIDQLSVLLASITGAPGELAAKAIAAAAEKSDKPVSVVWSGRRAKCEKGFAVLEAARVPIIQTPVRQAEAMARLAHFAEARRRLLPRKVPSVGMPDGLSLPAGAVTLSEVESKAVLASFGVDVTREVLVPEGGDAARLARGLQPPFAVKIVSRDIAHKTEAGGVRLGIQSEAGLPAVMAEIVASARLHVPGARIDGVLVSEMAKGVEALIGIVVDESFGPAVALGLGGVLTEVLKDVTFRIAPFDVETAREMIAELKGAKLFAGYRGAPPADVEALARMLVQVSGLAWALRDRIEEMDINPVFVGEKGAVAADALVVLR